MWLPKYLGALVGCSAFRIIGKAPPTFCRERIWLLSMLQASLFFVFLIEPAANVLSGVSRTDAHLGGASLAIGLTLTAIRLMAIPISNAAVDPAPSHGSAVFGGHLWLFPGARPIGGGFH